MDMTNPALIGGSVDPRRDAILALGAGLLGGRGNFGQRMAQGVGAAVEAQNMGRQLQMREALTNAQLQQYQAASAETQRKRQSAEAQAAAQKAFYSGLTPGEDGKVALTQADVLRGISAGIPQEDIKAMVESGNWGRQKVGREVTVAGPDGSPQTVLMDEYGGRVGDAMPQPVKLDRVDTGSSIQAVDPYQPGGPIAKSMTPGEVASNRVAQANLGLRQQELQASTAKKAAPTEYQVKAAGFSARMEEADRTLGGLAQRGVDQPGWIKRAVEAVPYVGEGLGTLANATQSSGQQRVEQAQRDFVNAVLRQESGAAIGKDEFDNARRQYFPQPGDNPAVIQQKARNRQLAIQSVRNSAGPAALPSGGTTAAGAPRGAGGWSSIGAGGWSAQEVK